MNKITAFLSGTKRFIIAHKIISGVVIVVLIFGGYYIVKARSAGTAQTLYVIGTADTGTIVSTVNGSGQVSASNEVSVSSKVSGDLVSVNVKSGDQVTSGQLIAQVDSRTAALNLENAQLSLENLTNPNSLNAVQTQNAVDTAKQSELDAETSLSSSYTTSLGSIANAFVNFPTIIQGLNTMFYTAGGTLNDTDTANLTNPALQYRNDAGVNFDKAKNTYDQTLMDYKAINDTSSTSTVEKVLGETLETARELMLAVKDTKNTVDFVSNLGKETTLKNIPTAQTNLNTWLSSVSSSVDSLSSAQTSISNAKTSIVAAQRSLGEKEVSLNTLQDTSTNVDVRSQQLTVDQQQLAYDNYFIRAPFDGVVAKLDIQNGDSVTSGEAVATIITKTKVADISLNEVDISKVKVGQKATLTFDAVPDLTITGEVAEVDLVGTVSQGVVSYNVKIAFDTEDDRVLSGMTAAASIATDVRQDVVTVPNGAVKTQGSTYYVDVVDPSTPVSTSAQGDVLTTAPTQQTVQVGISDDTSTEITSGLNVGDKIITKTVTPSAVKVSTTASAASLFGGGGRGGGGGATRAITTGK